MANPLLDQQGLPKFDSIDSTHVKPAMDSVLEQLDTDLAALEAKLSDASAPEYTSVIEEMEKMEAPLGYAWGVVGHLMGVDNSDELREVHTAMQPAVIAASTKLSQSATVYKALETVNAASKAGSESLDEAQARILDSSLMSMKLSGVGLEGAEKERFNAIRLELGDLSTQYSNNVLDATKAYSLTLTDKAEVEGLPPSALELAAQRAAADEETKGATPEAGPWKLGLDMPSYLPAMKFIKNGAVREKLYRAFVTRAGEANEPLIGKILSLKQEQAQILGFNSYAEVSIVRKMADSVEAVDELTDMLREKAYPAAVKELAQLLEFAKESGFEGDELALWDTTFWSERQSEKLFEFEEEELRPYFALPNVLDGLFGLCKRIFGVDIVRADGEATVWHEDVQFFKVLDETSGEHIASFFLDPYSRPETKRGGAWMDVCIGRSQVLDRKPVAYLTCNGSPPVGDKPSLMTFNEVTTLFHETGHGLQHMLTNIVHGGAAGINGVEWDAVELPSQFMENFCYDVTTMYGAEDGSVPGMAVHYETGEPLPRDLFAKLNEQKTHLAGMVMLRQLYFGALDMHLHHRYDARAEGAPSPFEVQAEVAKKYTIMAPLEEDRFLCAFGHIFAGGYSAGYYSYKWAEVLSADAFAAFEEAGLDNHEEVRAIGRRFRETVLGLGGGRHPSQVYRDFRGRDPSPEALLRHSGL